MNGPFQSGSNQAIACIWFWEQFGIYNSMGKYYKELICFLVTTYEKFIVQFLVISHFVVYAKNLDLSARKEN